MERQFQVIELSENYKRALRMADTIVAKKKLDRMFERNMMIKQKIHGVIICLLSTICAWWLSEFYGQTEYFLLAVGLVLYGIYLICTKENLEKALREQMKHEEEVYKEYKNR